MNDEIEVRLIVPIACGLIFMWVGFGLFKGLLSEVMLPLTGFLFGALFGWFLIQTLKMMGMIK